MFYGLGNGALIRTICSYHFRSYNKLHSKHPGPTKERDILLLTLLNISAIFDTVTSFATFRLVIKKSSAANGLSFVTFSQIIGNNSEKNGGCQTGFTRQTPKGPRWPGPPGIFSPALSFAYANLPPFVAQLFPHIRLKKLFPVALFGSLITSAVAAPNKQCPNAECYGKKRERVGRI